MKQYVKVIHPSEMECVEIREMNQIEVVGVTQIITEMANTYHMSLGSAKRVSFDYVEKHLSTSDNTKLVACNRYHPMFVDRKNRIYVFLEAFLIEGNDNAVFGKVISESGNTLYFRV